MNDQTMPELPNGFRFAVRKSSAGNDHYYCLVLEQKKWWGWKQVERELIATPGIVYDRPHSFPRIGKDLWDLHLQHIGQKPGPFKEGVLY